MRSYPMERPVRIANCSGFYGDRFAAAREMVEGGEIDVLTGDYLAELTMLILWKARRRDPHAGFATTFLRQMEDVLELCWERGVRVVANAGGLNPRGLVEALSDLASGRGIPLRVAYVDGDDLMPELDTLRAGGHRFPNLDTGRQLDDLGLQPVTANAYLGGWGIARALNADADVVVTGRVTDASLVLGPAAWWHDWERDDWDALAGAVTAGHVIECGPQATGGNYALGSAVQDKRLPGYPIAEVWRDGSSVITKHPGTGGLVSVGTVTSQLLYEIAEPAYRNPDVIASFDTVELTDLGQDRVLIAGNQGAPPTGELKVAMNCEGGFLNTMTLVLTGLNLEEKAASAEDMLFGLLGGRDSFAESDVRMIRIAHDGVDDTPRAYLRISVKDPDRSKVGRRFSNAVNELSLGGYAGAHATTPPSDASAYGQYWPTSIEASAVRCRVVLPDGEEVEVEHTAPSAMRDDDVGRRAKVAEEPSLPLGATMSRPLGVVCGARSGDKGGNANVGVWASSTDTYQWLAATLTPDLFRELMPEVEDLEVRRFEFPNLLALNFVVVGLLGTGVAGSTRPDPQAKSLGEQLRSKSLAIPVRLIDQGVVS